MGLVDEARALLVHLAGAEWVALSLGLLLHLLRRACRARAWQHMVLAVTPGLSFPKALGVCMSSLGVASLAPVRGAGELTRIAMVKRHLPGAPCAALVSTFALEALVDTAFAATLLGTAVVLGLVPGLPGGVSTDSGLALTAVSPACIALCGRALLERRFRELRQGAAPLSARRLVVRSVLPWLGLSWLLRLAAIGCFLSAFSIEPSAGLVLAVLAAQLLAALVPVSWAALGAEQALIVLALAVEASRVDALSFGLGMHAGTTLVNVAVGLPVLLLMAPGSLARLLFPGRRQRAASADARPSGPQPAPIST